jgi:hypothetical protein
MSASYTTDLFSEPARSWDILEQQEYRLITHIERLTASALSSHPHDALINELADRFSLNVPVLHETGATASQEEVDLDLGRRFLLGQPRLVRGLRVTIAVPFSGDRRILDLRPDSYEDLPLPKGIVSGNTVLFSTEGEKLTAEDVRGAYDAWLALVNRHLSIHREKLGGFNERLRPLIASTIEARVATLREHADLIHQLGLQPAV